MESAHGKSAGEQAYERIKAIIFEVGHEGRTYSERSLSRELNAGLAPIRSAIARLRTEGLIEVMPQAGFRLRPLTLTEIRDFYEVRIVVERQIAGRLAGRMNDTRTETVKSILKEQEDCAASGNAKAFRRLDMDFHKALAGFYGNAEFMRILDRLEDRMHQISVGLHGRHPERLEPLVRQHSGILDALLEGDSEIASTRLEEHIAWGRSMLLGGAVGENLVIA